MSAVDWIRLVIGSLFVLAGIVIFFTELYGVFHFKYVLNRMHAAAMGDTRVSDRSDDFFGIKLYDFKNVSGNRFPVVRFPCLLTRSLTAGGRYQRQSGGTL